MGLAIGNPMNTLAHPPESHCKCRPLENALNAFVNIQYLDATDDDYDCPFQGFTGVLLRFTGPYEGSTGGGDWSPGRFFDVYCGHSN